jgi:uncharacterized protein
MTAETGIDYAKLTQDALRGVVRTILTTVSETGSLPGNHHFFISFLTNADGVSVSKRLREQYPDEMTIVIQHQFFDLHVHDDRFEVKLKFNGIPEKLVVPFSAIRVFVDPSAQFAIPFEVPGPRSNDESRPKPVLAGALPAPTKPVELSPRRTTTLTSVPTSLPDKAQENTAPAKREPSLVEPLVEAGEKSARPALRAVEQPSKTPGSADVVDFNSFRKK